MTLDSTPDLVTFVIACTLVAAILVCLLILLLRPRGGGGMAELEARLRADSETLRNTLVEFDRNLRREIADGASLALSAAFDKVQAGARAQSEELNRFGANIQAVLGSVRTQLVDTTEKAATATELTLREFGEQHGQRLDGMGRLLRETDEKTQRGMDGFAERLREEQERLRALVAQRLDEMRAGNEAKLEDMRKAVDEQLKSALEKQVGESFQRVADQFAQVQQAIGQVQSVAGQVGDLKRLFSNVKTRGGWGEAQLDTMLADSLPAGSYERNWRLRDGSAEAVDFALRVPVQDREPVWLPIDAKFPTEDYDRLLTAAEEGNREDELEARRGLDRRIRLEAARICSKYIVAPRTLEFAILYVPTDGLFAEISRSPGLIETVRREHRVMVMGPSLLPAFLHTVRVGHLTVALQQKASEIGETLGAVKAEWGKLGGALDGLAKRAELLSKGIEETRLRTRAVGRTLRAVGAIEYGRAEQVLGLDAPALADAAEDEPDAG